MSYPKRSVNFWRNESDSEPLKMQQSNNTSPTPEMEIANRICSIPFAINSIVNSWAYYLVDPYFNEAPELRNRLFGILVCGLVDSCEEYRPRIRGLEIQAKKRGVLAAPHYLGVLARYLDLAQDLLGIFSPSDIVLLSGLRNQWLHGHWDEIHKSSRTIRIVKGGKVSRDKVTAIQYNKIFHNALLPNPDASMEILRERFCNYRTFFGW